MRETSEQPVWQCVRHKEAALLGAGNDTSNHPTSMALCRKHHPSLPSKCLSFLSSNETAALLAAHGEGSADVHFDAAVQRVLHGLPGSSTEAVLTFLQGHRQTIEYSLQAAIFALRHNSSLVDLSDLLLYCNNGELAATTLLRFLSRYPHRTRVLIQTADNSGGYRCGHLHAVSVSRSIWAAYRNVLFLHPDVFLLPRGAAWMELALHLYPSQRFALLVTQLTPRVVKNYTSRVRVHVSSQTLFGTDLFVFRPQLVLNVSGASGMGGSAAEQGSAAPDTSLWRGVCVADPAETIDWPERRLWRLTMRYPTLPVRVLGTRDTSTEGPDGYGVWHSHDLAAVARWLEEAKHSPLSYTKPKARALTPRPRRHPG